MTTVLGSILTYVKAYAGLETGAPVWVDYLGDAAHQYSIVPIPGERTIERYLDGSRQMAYPFAFQRTESTADEASRQGNQEFFEALSDWMDSQTEAGALPTMGAKQTPELIEVLGQAFLEEQGQSDTGVYQVQCRLVYTQTL